MPDGSKIATTGLGQEDFGKNFADFLGPEQIPYALDCAIMLPAGKFGSALQERSAPILFFAMQELQTFQRASWQAR